MNRRILERGSTEHYIDAPLYDYEYRRRRMDVRYYVQLARAIAAGPHHGTVSDPAAGAGPLGEHDPVLELGCGSGRIVMPLARAGIEVLGVDLSRPMLRRATERIARLPRTARSRVRLLRADLRQLPLTRRFGLIIAAFNTLQHVYAASEVVDLLRSLRGQLKPGGCLAFDVLVPDLDWLVRDPDRRWARTRFTHPTTGERLVYTTNHTYDPISQVVDVRIYYDPMPGQPGKSWVVRLAHRQFFPQELRALIEASGLAVAACHGGFKGESLASESDSQLYLTCRPADLETVTRYGQSAVAALG